MALRINYDPGSSNLSSIINLQYKYLTMSMEKLSSGLKINRAADGPVQLVISEQLRTQIASLNSQIDNSTNQIAKYETASAAVMELRSKLTDLRSLAISAGNSGVNSEASQEALANEANAITAAFNEAIDSAEFNQSKLLDGSSGSLATVSDLTGVDLSSAEAAEASIGIIDTAIAELDSVQVNLGSTVKNELEATKASMQVTRQNLMAAESIIRDTDYAKTISDFIGNRIQLQIGVALMAHSSMNSMGVLKLLGA